MPLTPEQIADGWIEHDGGTCPVHPDDLVWTMLRYGFVGDGPAPAGYHRWDHGRTPESAADVSLRRNDITAYKPENRHDV